MCIASLAKAECNTFSSWDGEEKYVQCVEEINELLIAGGLQRTTSLCNKEGRVDDIQPTESNCVIKMEPQSCVGHSSYGELGKKTQTSHEWIDQAGPAKHRQPVTFCTM